MKLQTVMTLHRDILVEAEAGVFFLTPLLYILESLPSKNLRELQIVARSPVTVLGPPECFLTYQIRPQSMRSSCGLGCMSIGSLGALLAQILRRVRKQLTLLWFTLNVPKKLLVLAHNKKPSDRFRATKLFGNSSYICLQTPTFA